MPQNSLQDLRDDFNVGEEVYVQVAGRGTVGAMMRGTIVHKEAAFATVRTEKWTDKIRYKNLRHARASVKVVISPPRPQNGLPSQMLRAVPNALANILKRETEKSKVAANANERCEPVKVVLDGAEVTVIDAPGEEVVEPREQEPELVRISGGKVMAPTPAPSAKAPPAETMKKPVPVVPPAEKPKVSLRGEIDALLDIGAGVIESMRKQHEEVRAKRFRLTQEAAQALKEENSLQADIDYAVLQFQKLAAAGTAPSPKPRAPAKRKSRSTPARTVSTRQKRTATRRS